LQDIVDRAKLCFLHYIPKENFKLQMLCYNVTRPYTLQGMVFEILAICVFFSINITHYFKANTKCLIVSQVLLFASLVFFLCIAIFTLGKTAVP